MTEAPTDTITIDLRDRVNANGHLVFLRAEMSAVYRSPFALVRYAEDGVEQREGLRLDMDKRSFIDHFDDASKEEILARAAPTIVKVLGDILSRR